MTGWLTDCPTSHSTMQLREVIEKNEDQQQLIESLRATVLQEKQLAVEVQQQLSRQEKELDRLRPLVETCDQLEAQLQQSNQQRDAYHATILAHEQTIQQRTWWHDAQRFS